MSSGLTGWEIWYSESSSELAVGKRKITGGLTRILLSRVCFLRAGCYVVLTLFPGVVYLSGEGGLRSDNSWYWYTRSEHSGKE